MRLFRKGLDQAFRSDLIEALPDELREVLAPELRQRLEAWLLIAPRALSAQAWSSRNDVT